MKPSELVVALGLVFASSTAASASITVIRCEIKGFKTPIIITEYSDGSPTRIGTATGIGNRAQVIRDPRTGALVVVELNTDAIPETLTSVQPDGTAVHSRHAIDISGKVVAPSQAWGICTKPSPV